MIDAAGPACVAVKPQLACFERLGAAGWAALAAVADHARAAGLLVIADAKRGDIDVSAAAYAQALVGATPTPFGEVAGLGADAFTANPYWASTRSQPFVDGARAAGAGLFVLVRTSNPGAADVEDLELAARRAGLGAAWRGSSPSSARPRRGCGLSEIGAVVGATAPSTSRALRELMPRTPSPAAGHRRAGRARRGSRAGLRARAARRAWSPRRARSSARTRRGGRRRPPADAARAEAERLRAAAWALA